MLNARISLSQTRGQWPSIPTATGIENPFPRTFMMHWPVWLCRAGKNAWETWDQTWKWFYPCGSLKNMLSGAGKQQRDKVWGGYNLMKFIRPTNIRYEWGIVIASHKDSLLVIIPCACDILYIIEHIFLPTLLTSIVNNWRQWARAKLRVTSI